MQDWKGWVTIYKEKSVGAMIYSCYMRTGAAANSAHGAWSQGVRTKLLKRLMISGITRITNEAGIDISQ